jgi:hypothetical protein
MLVKNIVRKKKGNVEKKEKIERTRRKEKKRKKQNFSDKSERDVLVLVD